LQIGHDLTGLGRGVITPDELSFLVEGDLTGDEEKASRRDDPVGVMPGRGRVPRNIDSCSFEFVSDPSNISVSS
jgi:hypothetical protein